ncbi:choice-of-anchor L domain-containing protein [Meridianimaribacter sp. CL38]|uniref:choice-of-anchor L domain-containing protein n=1 Tax=Meridianimaribacter sp. CL38 TaxID=2213021 RepID=UPI001039E375|nr:choice-of-anchor L domain-containing protein [Meridianimaribacter sp. CL38]
MRKITLFVSFFIICLSMQSQTYLQENFDTEIPATWTITDGGAATGDSWVSGLQGGFNSLDGSNGAIVDSDANGNGTLLQETLTSPVFDSSAATGLFLDFQQYFNSIGGDAAIVEVYDGSAWVEVLNQTADVGTFATPDEQHIDITAYANANMQIRFYYDDGDVWAWYWMIDNVHVYNSTCNNPSGLDALVNATTVDLSWIEGGTEDAWEVINQVAGGPVPTEADSGVSVGTNSLQITDLTEGTDYEFYVRADCGADGFSIWAGPFVYRISGPGETCSNPIMVTTPLPYVTTDDTSNYGDDYTGGPGDDCGVGFGYLGGDDVVYSYTPAVDTSIDIELSGIGTYTGIFVYTDCANIGTQCETGAVNGFAGGDMLIDNFSVTGGTTYYIVISTWPSPQSTPYTLTITENTCVDPVATYEVVSDCINGPQFFVDVNLTDLGSAGTITISDNQGSTPQNVDATGIYTFGPFANNTGVEIFVVNDDDANCALLSPSLTQEICLDYVVDCTAGPVNFVYCYENNDTNVFTFTSSDGTPLNFVINSGQVENGWDELHIYDTDGTELTPPDFYGNNGDVSGVNYQSLGDTISFTVTADGVFSCETEGYTPLDITVSCATCINPQATYAIVDDCDNGDQFLIDVNVTSMGDATSLTISNNINADTVPANAEGTYQIGPFPFLQDVIVTISNDQDGNCVINSPAIQQLACPPDNDNPCNATVASVNTDDSCTVVTPGTVLAATDSGVPSGTCAGNPHDDVWFEFTANSEAQIISLANITGGTFNLDFGVYEGTCDNLTELYCTTETAGAVTNLVVGNTYYVRVFSFDGEDNTTTFDLCIRPSPGNVLVDQTTYTIEELVLDVLIDSPCAQVTNITYSTGTDYGDVNGIGYFYRESDGFPFENGILLTTGDASLAAGPNQNAMSDGLLAWLGDPDLDAAVGIQSSNATVIEFDFVPLDDELSFDFIMASEEYNGSTGGTFECTYSDAFAFLLTDENGVTTNLAVLPGTNTPILVTNIHPDNPGCSAINEEYFGGYTPNNLPPTSFDGRTTVFTAYSEVNIGETYHIKLVIGDDSNGGFDTALDSGVFLKAGSFDIGEVDLGVDITIDAGTAVCDGQPVVLDTQAPQVDHVWYKDGFLIEGATTSILEVTEAGEYTTQIIFSPQCIISDTIVIEFLPNPEVESTPSDLIACDESGFGEFYLYEADAEVLAEGQNPDDFTISYHLTEADAIDNVGELSSPYTNVSDPQTVYVRVTNNATQCYSTTSLNLVVEDPLFTSFPTDFDYEVCPNATIPIEITAIPENYQESEVTINWYQDGGLIDGENGLTIPVLIAGYYEIEVINNTTTCSYIAGIDIVELESCVIPEGISPGVSPGQNDTFDLSSYGVTRLEIFNRNGVLVYSKDNYTNEWYGQSNSGDELPVGTYFYTMIYENGAKKRSAWVYINK